MLLCWLSTLDNYTIRSGSMEPAFYRGDLLWLTNPSDTPYVVGDITVYKIPGKDIPIVHRILETHQTYEWHSYCFIICLPIDSFSSPPLSGPNPTDQSLLTKGGQFHPPLLLRVLTVDVQCIDNNHLDDLELYEGLRWLERKHVIGKVNG